MKISLPCVSPLYGHLDDQSKKLKPANAGSVDGAQEENTGLRIVLPGIYAGGKSCAHIVRRLQVQPKIQAAKRTQAAEKIQAVWRGRNVRSNIAAQAQQLAPYKSLLHFQQATYGFSLKDLKDRPVGSAQAQAVYEFYLNTNNIPSGQPAFLHSSQRESAFDLALASYNVSPESAAANGNIYSPLVAGIGKHDMKLNSIWLLGLAHHGKTAVLTTSLDDETLVRGLAKYAPEWKRSTEHNFSALGREVLGMVQNGHFVPQYDSQHGFQSLIPTWQARFAKIEDFKTPWGMKKEEIKKKLAAKEIDVSKIT